LIDYAKTKHRLRRGGAGCSDFPLDKALTISASETDFDLLALRRSVNAACRKEEHLAKIVELRFFSGVTWLNGAV
jgi:hypothetical protein